MKIELNLITNKIVILTGFCAVLNGLLVGLVEDSPLSYDRQFQPVNNYSLFWSNFY